MNYKHYIRTCTTKLNTKNCLTVVKQEQLYKCTRRALYKCTRRALYKCTRRALYKAGAVQVYKAGSVQVETHLQK